MPGAVRPGRLERPAEGPRRPGALVLGRWEHVPQAGSRQSLVFYSDGVFEYDGPTEGLEFQRRARYRFVDDRTIALLLTPEAITALREQFPERSAAFTALKPGDEFARLTVSFPAARTMVVTAVNGTRVTWTKAD